MKKSLAILLAAVLLLSSLTAGCSKKSTSSGNNKPTQPTKEESSDSSSKDDVEQAIDDAADFLVSADKKKWPSELLDPDMPEYTKGELFAWTGDESDCTILIHDTNEDDLSEYQELLISKGWVEEFDDYKKPPRYIQFQFNTDTTLQISAYKDDVLEWPTDRAPDVPALTKGVLTEVYFDQEYPYALQLYSQGLTEDDILEYEKALLSNGFIKDGDMYYIKEGATLNGNEYSKLTMWFENNGADEWMINLSGE